MLNNAFKVLLLIASLLVMETSVGGGVHEQGFVTGSLSADGGSNRFAGTKPEGEDQPAIPASELATASAIAPPLTALAAPVRATRQRIASGHPIRAPPLRLMH